MRIKNIAAIALSIILIAGWPFGAFALDDSIEQGLEGSEVTCTVQEIYDFSVPDDAEITFPNTSEYLGDFVVGNILLKSNETLRLNLNIGMLSKTDDNNSVITYDVVFNAPGEIDKTKIGSAYGIGVSIDADEFKGADPGTYRAPLKFQVISNTSSEVVWEQTVYLEAVKNNAGQGNQHQNSSNTDYDDEDMSTGETSNNSTEANTDEQDTENYSEEPVPATVDEEFNEDVPYNSAQAGFTDETTPLGKPEGNFKLPYWVIIGCGGVIIVILFYFFIKSRKSNNHA